MGQIIDKLFSFSMGIIKRKLKRKESKQITKEVMAMGLKDSHLRFTMAILKTMEVVNR